MRVRAIAWAGIFTLGGCSAELSESEQLAEVQQAAVWTSVCSTVPIKNVTTFGAVPTPFGTQPPGASWNNLDDTHAIQDAIEAARLSLPSSGTCSVEVYFPSGDYFINSTLWVPSRVNLRGASRATTRIIRATDAAVVNKGHLIDLSNYHKLTSDTLCQGEGYIKISSLQLEMRQGVFNTAKPVAVGLKPDGTPDPDEGHCIRSPVGVHHVELRDLQLNSCTSYGIGLQITTACANTAAHYRDITISGVKIARSGRDGIDMKQRAGSANRNTNIDIHNVCVADVGWNDSPDGSASSASGFDLAGTDIWLNTVTHVSPTPNYGATLVTGIRVRSKVGPDDRNVTDSLIENFYVSGTNQGVFFDCRKLSTASGAPCVQSEPNDGAPYRVRLRNGKVSGIRTVASQGGDGIVLRGHEHSSEGALYVTNVGDTKLSDESQGSSVALSGTAPALPSNPACAF
jgi:hypothetical protein